MRYIVLLLIPFASFYSSCQIIIRGNVSNNEKIKLLTRIYQSEENDSNNFYGDFELTIDSLGSIYYFDATGYIKQEIVIKDTSFLSVVLQKRNDYEKLMERSKKHQRRSMKQAYRQNKRGKMIYGGCCFVSGTHVLMANQSQKSIEALALGDSIFSYDFDKEKMIVSIILDIDTIDHDNIIEITLEGNVKIKNTTDHPYYIVGKGICSFNPKQTFNYYGIKAQKMQIDDECYFYDSGELKRLKIKSIEKIPGIFKTYNLSSLDNNTNYFVNGVLVNNEKNPTIHQDLTEK